MLMGSGTLAIANLFEVTKQGTGGINLESQIYLYSCLIIHITWLNIDIHTKAKVGFLKKKDMATEIEVHNIQIKEEFAKQAEGYTLLASHHQELERLVKIGRAGKEDNVLDVACGSGIVSLAFAKHVSNVIGIDITDEMLEQAVMSQRKQELQNVSFLNADVNHIPFETNTFDIVVTRFSFHHMVYPQKVLSEMIRVCKPGGMVVVADVALPQEKVGRYNEMERLRDPSHVSALSIEAFQELLNQSDLNDIAHDYYCMAINLEDQLNSSFPQDKERLRQMIINDITVDSLGINAMRSGNSVILHYPIHIFAGCK